MAQLEDCLKALENQKHSYSDCDKSPFAGFGTSESRENSGPAYHTRHHTTPSSRQPQSIPRQQPHIQPSIESDSPESSSAEEIQPQYKRPRYSKGIKVTPSYTLKVSSSLREWGDWKRDMERVFEGDPDTYYQGPQKIIKALDYLDTNLKSLWYTHSEQQKGIRKWSVFLQWTRDNV